MLLMILVFCFLVIRTDDNTEKAYQYLREHVEQAMARSAFQNIKLSQIFKDLHPKNSFLSQG